MTDPVPAARPPCPQGVPAEAAGPSPPPRAGARPADASGGPPLLLRALLVGGFLALAALAVIRVDERVRRLEDFRVDLGTTWFASSPDWLPDSEKKALREAAASTGSVALDGEGVPESVAARLAADPRVARVVASRRAPPGSVEVLIELRRPVALVESGSRTTAVDREGVLVPGDYASRPLPRIRGSSEPTPAPGSAFGDTVKAGAAVASAIPQDLLAATGLDVVDVSGAGGAGGVVLRRRSEKGSGALAVEWGRAPGSPAADLDPAADSKVRRLRLASDRFPGLKGLRTVRLAFDDLVVVPAGGK